MATYYVCSDNIDGKEQSRINALCDALKKKGHTAINGGVGPNTVQSHGQSSSSSGQIGVFICGGVDIQVFWDFVQGIGSYYHYKRFIYVYASDTATTDKWLTCNGAKNTPTVQAHDDNYSGGRGDAIGKTVHQYCSEHKDKIWYACGKLGCTFQDVINNFLAGIGAGSDNDNGSEASTIKEAIKDILKMRDGEIECRTVNEVMYINKIPEPEKAEISLVEGIDIIQGSINITDINPDTINHLTVHWQGGEDIIMKDDALIERFGEKKAEMDAVKRLVTTGAKKSKSSTDSASTDSSSTDSTSTETDTSSESSVEEVPVTNYEDAKSFASTEWAKIKRDNGHTIECRVIGSPLWEQGLWVRVYIPSFEENGFMYITKVSHDESSTGWVTNLTLQDYPPGFGEPEEASDDEEEEEEEDTEDATT